MLVDLPAAHRHAIEFRHPSWFSADVLELLRAHDVALVIGDRPEVHGFQTFDVTADFVYVRFHYGSRGARGNYSESELHEWAWRIRHWQEDGDVYAYFNNDWEGFAPANAHALGRILGTARDDVSEPAAAAT